MNNLALNRMEAGRAELAERIARAHPGEGQMEIRPGLYLNPISSPDYAVHGILEPSAVWWPEAAKK